MPGRGYSATQTAAQLHVFTLKSGTAPAAAYLIEARFGSFSTSGGGGSNRFPFQRSTVGTTPTSATEDVRTTRSPAPGGDIVTSWVGAPTLSGSNLLILENGLRQGYARAGRMWTPPRASAVPVLYDTEQATITNTDSGGSPACTLFFEEHPPAFAVKPTRRPSNRDGWFYRAEQGCKGLATSVGVNNNIRQAWTGTFIDNRRAMEKPPNGMNLLLSPPVVDGRVNPPIVILAGFPYYMEV